MVRVCVMVVWLYLHLHIHHLEIRKFTDGDEEKVKILQPKHIPAPWEYGGN